MELDSIDPYRQYWKQKFEKKEKCMEERRDLLRQVANQLANVLKNEYQLNEIFLIGSLVTNQAISWHSDIDLAVKGIPDEIYFRILSHLYEFLPQDVELDLIPFESAKKTLQDRILKEGIPL